MFTISIGNFFKISYIIFCLKMFLISILQSRMRQDVIFCTDFERRFVPILIKGEQSYDYV